MQQEIGFARQVAGDLFLDVFFERFRRSDAAVRESGFEKLLVHFGSDETADLIDRQLIIRVHPFQVGFLHAERGSALRRRLEQLGHIDVQRIADLLADKRRAVFVAHADQTYVSLLDFRIALFERHIERVFLLDRIDVGQFPETVQEVGAITVAHLIFDPDRIPGYFIFFTQVDTDLRSQTHFEHELVFGAVVEIQRLLFVARNHIADERELLFFDVIEAGFRSGAVRLLGNDSFAVHFIDNPHRNHPRAETRNVRFAFVGAQRLIYSFTVIGLTHGHLQQRGEIFKIFSDNIHLSVIF